MAKVAMKFQRQFFLRFKYSLKHNSRLNECSDIGNKSLIKHAMSLIRQATQQQAALWHLSKANIATARQ